MVREPLPTERTLLLGVVVARWGTWAWAAVTVVWQRDDLRHPLVGALAVVASGLWAAGTTAALRRRPGLLLHGGWALAELAFGFLLLVGDGVVFEPGHTLDNSQNLAGMWPLVSVLAAAVVLAPWLAGIGGVVVASGRFFDSLANGERSFPASRVVSFASTAVFYLVAAIVWSLVTRRLRLVETEVLTRRARDEVARTLHDGVLQTLALVERRAATTDPELAAEARASDRELRAWLYGGSGARGEREPDAFDVRLRDTAARIAARHDVPVTVNVLADRAPRAEVAHAVAGAVGEAVTNAAKHAGAGRVVVYAEVDDDGAVFASVRDDGRGFDVDAARRAHRGLVRSIDERVAAVGGRVEIVSGPGQGTEVRLWAT